MKMEQFLPWTWTIARPGVKEHASEVSFTDRAHLNNLGVGKQIVLPHGDFQVSEPMDQGGSQLRDQLRFLDACHQVMNHQQQRRRMKQWKRHQPMAEEELDFEGDRCRLMKVAC